MLGKLEQPNVTKLSSKLSMTRSAISKVVKKLSIDGDIISYQCEANKKDCIVIISIR